MITKVDIEEFLSLSEKYPILDVRSPGEYTQACISGAYSLPLFSDEERKVVGTAYKQQGRQQAIKIGLVYYGTRMLQYVETVEEILKKHKENTNGNDTTNNTLLVHCWRGGMRSSAIAWLFDLYGFKVYQLNGGYKSFRNWVLKQFELPYNFKVLGGYTGSGKTIVLNELAKLGKTIIDLEDIAKHKGSAFGEMEEKQPSQEMFENLLALQLFCFNKDPESGTIWLEDESQRIGLVNLPNAFWETMRDAPVYFLDIPFEERLKYIVAEYGKLKKEKLINAVIRIQKRLGGLGVKNAINYLLDDNIEESFRILLKYYDKHYEKGLNNRKAVEENVINISCEKVDAKVNCRRLRNHLHSEQIKN